MKNLQKEAAGGVEQLTAVENSQQRQDSTPSAHPSKEEGVAFGVESPLTAASAAPDPTLRHLQSLFSFCAPYGDGMIEVAYTNPTGKPNQAELFDAADIDKAVSFIKEKNATPGVNIYIGAALRLPDTIPHNRCNINDFYAVTALWVDIDDGDAAQRAPEIYKTMPPSFIVVTGRHPALRLQLWWTLDEPETDKDRVRKALAELCQAFSGDPSVVDPIRIMRAAGTAAWPHKKGRVQEITEFRVPADAAKNVSIDQIMALWPARAQATAATGNTDDSKPRSADTGRRDIATLLEKTKEAGQWDINMTHAIAAMIGKGWTDEKILITCTPYIREGHALKEVQEKVQYARSPQRFNKPDPTGTVLLAEEWPDPKPIQAPLRPVMPFDTDTLLPEVLQAWVKDAANRMPCPPDFIAAAVVVALGSLIGARCAIKPKSKDDWLIVPNLWGGIVGSPSAKKSPAISEALKPLDRIVALAIKDFEAAQKEFQLQYMIYEAQQGNLTARLKDAAKTQKRGSKK